MHHAELLLYVRQLAQETFRRLGVGSDAPPQESILIHNGYYCGRRFVCHPLQAIWFFADNQVKFYASDGCVTQVVAVTAPATVCQSRIA